MGTSAGFEVTIGSLEDKRAQLESDNKTLRKELQQLQSSEKTLSGKWEGSSKEAFETAFNKDLVQMEKFIALIDKYVEALSQIIANYAKAERDNTKIATTRSYK